MKNIIYLEVIIIVCIFILTGCVSSKDRKSILEALEKNDYIYSDWQLIDTVINSASPIPDIESYEYIYQDKDNKLHKIYIPTDYSKENEYDIKIFYDIEKLEKENPLFENNKNTQSEFITEYTMTDDYKELVVKENKILFVKYWKVIE